MLAVNTTEFSIKSDTIANPAGGADFTIPAILSLRRELLSLRFTFTCDATVMNRLVHLHHTDGTNVTGVSTGPGLQTASEAIIYEFATSQLTLDASGPLGLMQGQIPTNTFMNGGDSIYSVIDNIQAGDAITDITLRYKFWYVT